MRSFVCFLLIGVAPLARLASQEPTTLEPGQQVRVTAPDLGVKKLKGTIESLDSATLAITADSTLRIPLTAVERLDVRVGARRYWAEGFAAGLLIGGALGAAIAYTGFTEGETPGREALIPIGGFAFALLGTGIGALITTDRWERVTVDHMRVGIGGRPDGGITLAASFAY